MSYRIAAVDVHKKMLAVVVTHVAGEGEYQFERRKFASTSDQLRQLAEWLVQQEVEEIVMESTAPYWKPVWAALERYWKTGAAATGRRQQDVRHTASVRGQNERQQFRADVSPVNGAHELSSSHLHRLPSTLLTRWLILRKGVRYEGRGEEVSTKSERILFHPFVSQNPTNPNPPRAIVYRAIVYRRLSIFEIHASNRGAASSLSLSPP